MKKGDYIEFMTNTAATLLSRHGNITWEINAEDAEMAVREALCLIHVVAVHANAMEAHLETKPKRARRKPTVAKVAEPTKVEVVH
jgi:hypothetical protein